MAGDKYKIDPKTNKKLYVDGMSKKSCDQLPYAIELVDEKALKEDEKATETEDKKSDGKKQDKFVTFLVEEHNKREKLFKSGKQPKCKTLPEVEKNVPWKLIHGHMGKKEWAMPICVVECAEEARPGYNSMQAHEYEDHPETLREKIKVVAQLLKKSKHAMAYTGAGISTS
eukprot:UN28257